MVSRTIASIRPAITNRQAEIDLLKWELEHAQANRIWVFFAGFLSGLFVGIFATLVWATFVR